MGFSSLDSDHYLPGSAVGLPLSGIAARGLTVYSTGGSHFFSQDFQVEADTRNTFPTRYTAGFSIPRL